MDLSATSRPPSSRSFSVPSHSRRPRPPRWRGLQSRNTVPRSSCKHLEQPGSGVSSRAAATLLLLRRVRAPRAFALVFTALARRRAAACPLAKQRCELLLFAPLRPTMRTLRSPTSQSSSQKRMQKARLQTHWRASGASAATGTGMRVNRVPLNWERLILIVVVLLLIVKMNEQ